MNLELLQIFLNIVLIFTALYLICIAAFTFGLFNLKERFHSINKNNLIKVSVLIAARNEEKNIEKLLESLKKQSFPKELFEVIIVNDHSIDNTDEIINDFINKNKELDVKLLKAEKTGKKHAISQALHTAINELVIVTDADCVLNDLWIESIVGFYQEEKCKMILAPVLLSPAENLFEKMQVLEHLSLIGSTAGSASIGFPVMCNGANMAYERKAALEVERFRKDFDIPSGDDMFLLEQFVKCYGHNNVKFLLSKSAVVKTKTCKTIKDFFRQRRRWVSKTKSYTSWKVIVTALIVLFFNLSIISLFVSAFFVPALWSIYILLTLLKFFIDFPLLKNITNFMNQGSLLKWVLPLEIIYPFYAVFTALSGIIFTKLKSENGKWNQSN
ncbi:MAG: glycosyltransferase [Lentimicrobiaceae bacterium]|nr:glycosyltransferase [Lentimicrobiaceae bacterium]